MKVNVKVFAALREELEGSELSVELPEGATLTTLLDQMGVRYPILKKYAPALHFAVNRKYASGNPILREGDEVALLPPVAGG